MFSVFITWVKLCLVMPFYPQNSWPSFGTYICVNSAILDVPGHHSVKIIVFSTFRLHNCRSTGLRVYRFNSSRLPSVKHICVEFVFSIRDLYLVHLSENIYLPFRWCKWATFRLKWKRHNPLSHCLSHQYCPQSDLTSFAFGSKWTNCDSFVLNSSCDWLKNVVWPRPRPR